MQLSNTRQVRVAIRHLLKYVDPQLNFILNHSKHAKENHATAKDKLRTKDHSALLWSRRRMYEAIDINIAEHQYNSTIIVAKEMIMAETILKSSDILESSTELLGKHMERYTAIVTSVTERATALTNALEKSQANLNSALKGLTDTLGDPRMTVALENAKMLYSAMDILIKLDDEGALERVVSSLVKARGDM